MMSIYVILYLYIHEDRQFEVVWIICPFAVWTRCSVSWQPIANGLIWVELIRGRLRWKCSCDSAVCITGRQHNARSSVSSKNIGHFASLTPCSLETLMYGLDRDPNRMNLLTEVYGGNPKTLVI